MDIDEEQEEGLEEEVESDEVEEFGETLRDRILDAEVVNDMGLAKPLFLFCRARQINANPLIVFFQIGIQLLCILVGKYRIPIMHNCIPINFLILYFDIFF